MNAPLRQPTFIEGDGDFVAAPHLPAVATALVALADRHGWGAATWNPARPAHLVAWPATLSPYRVPRLAVPDPSMGLVLTAAAARGMTRPLTVLACLVAQDHTYRVDLGPELPGARPLAGVYRFLDRSV